MSDALLSPWIVPNWEGLGHVPAFNIKGDERGMLKAPGLD